MTRPLLSLFLFILSAVLPIPPAHAAEPWPDACKLQLQASLPFTLEHGHLVIAVALDGVPRHFMVDTGGLLSSVRADVAAEQKLKTYRVRDDLDIDGVGKGKRIERYATADTLTFGKLKADDVHLLIEPSNSSLAEDGILAPDFLRDFDLEFDFATKTLNLFKPHRCADHVVYWGGPYVVLPMDITDQGHIRVRASLDGAELETMLDTGSPGTVIGARTVAAKFDLTFGPGDVTLHGVNGGATRASGHRFRALSLGGLTVNNPLLMVAEDETAWRSDYASLLLGLKELSLFHIYIAYRERKLYLPQPPG